MKTLKNEKFKEPKVEPNNDYKSMILFCIRQSGVKGLTFGDIQDRMKLIDSINKCNGDIKLENEEWKNVNEVLNTITLFYGGNKILSEQTLKELSEFGEKIKLI